MKRLVFLVEGTTEIILINKHVIPYLSSKGFFNHMQAQKIITNRKLNVRGGNISYEYLKNDLERIFAHGNVIITTFLDFFRLPNNFPGYTVNSKAVMQIETALHEEFGNDLNFIPYIQLHEVEALMFCNLAGFEIVVDKLSILEELEEIIDTYPNPEDINTKPETAPSKRLQAAFKYDKVADGELILDAIGIEAMILKCPRFAEWMVKLEAALLADEA